MEGRIDQWQLRKRQKRKRNTNRSLEAIQGTRKRPLKFFGAKVLPAGCSPGSGKQNPRCARNDKTMKTSNWKDAHASNSGHAQLARLGGCLAGAGVYPRFAVSGHRLRWAYKLHWHAGLAG